jgi:hypothetical protein
MILPLVALAILAVVVSRSLMGVVAREHGVPAARSVAEPTPTPRVRADDTRTLLSPAAGHRVVEPVTESNAF